MKHDDIDFWIGFSGFLLVLLLVVFTVIVRVCVDNACVDFVNDALTISPASGTIVAPVTVSGYIKSNRIIPNTVVTITITNPVTGVSGNVLDPTFPDSVYSNCCAAVSIIFVPQNVANGTVFTDIATYPIEARFYSNGQIFATASTSYTVTTLQT